MRVYQHKDSEVLGASLSGFLFPASSRRPGTSGAALGIYLIGINTYLKFFS